jgi:type II secretory pathway pseudopilin PulG
MVELLVVVAVIAILAGLLIPVVGVVRRMANDFKCGSQLQQIAGAIEVYKHENDDLFPARLRWRDNDPLAGSPITSDLFHSGGPLKGLTKILLCPHDAQRGQDTRMGRPRAWEDLSNVHTPDSSYLYEVSSVALNAGQINFFFKDRSSKPAVGDPEATWAGGKQNQQRFGNRKDDGVTYGDAFPPTLFPIIRCYWHHKWRGQNRYDQEVRKVKNVSWNLNVFNSTPYWEHDVNPAIPIE